MNRRPVDGDLCYGVRAVAAALGVKHRQALRLVEEDRIPFWREGRTICARRSTLAAWVAEREAAARLKSASRWQKALA